MNFKIVVHVYKNDIQSFKLLMNLFSLHHDCMENVENVKGKPLRGRQGEVAGWYGRILRGWGVISGRQCFQDMP